MKQRLFRWALLLLSVLVISTTQASKKVWMLGDSTMTEYDDSEPTGGRGWGMYFGNFLINGWTHVNMAKGGRDSRGGYNELWASCKNDVEAGDYVIIQFAHNDAACGGADYEELVKFYTDKGDTEGLAAIKALGRGTNPHTTYKDMLKKICDEVKAKGATPILASAVCRCYMQNGVVRRDGRHDIGGSYDAIVDGQHVKKLSVPEGDHSYDYPYQMKLVAQAENVAFIDMTTATADLMASYEAQGTGNAFAVMFDKKIEANDGTHYNVTGALMAARLCAQLIQQEQGTQTTLAGLASNIYVPTDMSFNPSAAAMGEVYVGQAATKEISLSALGLTPAEGNVQLTATTGIMLSYDKQNWDTSLDASYSMGTLIKTFYVKVPITATGAFNGTVTATLGDKHVELPVSVTGIELGGGDPFTATWSLNSNNQPVTTEGVSVTAANALLSQLGANGYTSTNGVQVAEGGTTGAWNAARIDNIENEYVEFSLTAPTGRTIDVTTIAMQLKEQGGDHLHFHIKYSTDDFATETSLFGFQSAADAWTDYTKGVNVKIEEGQTLKVRVFPWSDAITTGNWLCIKDVVITGQSKDANGVNISGTISYALDKGGLLQSDDVVMDPNTLTAGFGYKNWSAGSALIVKGTATYQGQAGEDNIVQTAIVNNTGAQWPNTGGKDYTLTLTLTPDYGFSFVPSKVSFKAARYGTGSGKISASIAAGEASEILFNDADVNRSGQSLTIASFEQAVTTSMTATADNSLKLNFWFPGLNGDNRTMGISNVVIEGTLVGAPETGTTRYALNTTVNPSETGSITRTPALENYKEGTQVKLTATPANGYQFVEWQDGNGNQVATTAETTVTMDAAKTMKAFFELKPHNPVAIPTPDGEYVDWNEATLQNCKIENNGANIGSTGGSTTATFSIQNDVEQDYTLSFNTGAKNCTAQIKVTITGGTNTYLDKIVDVSNTGAWDLTEEHSLDIAKLPAGTYTLTFAVVSNTGSYAGNWGKLAIRKKEGPVDPSAAIITKTDGSDFVTSEGTPGGASAPQWETANNNWGYIKDGSTLTYEVRCQQTARVKVSIEDTKYASDATATFAFMKDNNTVATAVVNATQDNYGTDEAETNAQLTAGENYTLVVTFNGSGGSWIMNCRNFQFEAINDTDPVYTLTTVCSPAEGGTVKPAGGSYKADAQVKLTATANPYYTFQKWEDESTNAERTLTMPAEDKTVTAYFQASPLTIPTTDVNPFITEWAACSNGRWNGSNLDSFSAGGTATYTITNTQDCSYILKYKAATANDGVQLKMQVKQGESVLFEQTQDVENTGGWQTYKDYEMNITALTQGDYTFVVNFLREAGSYTANVKDIQFKADLPIVAGQMLTLTVDGIAMGESVLNPLVAEGHTATITKSLTTQPTIIATFDGVDGSITMSNVEPVIEGSTLTYVKSVAGTDYTFIFNNYHPYVATANDQTHSVTPGNGTSVDNVWTDGTITMTFGGDWGFKMNNGEKTITVPTNWQVKQVVFAGTGDNYNADGTISAMTSEGSTVYMPFNNVLKKSEDQDFVFNIADHVAGTPVKFTVANCGQMYIRTVKIVYEEVAVATAPAVLSSSISSTEHKNHAVVTVTYDHAVTTAAATFGNKAARVKGLGTTTVKYTVWDLDFNTDYTFKVAAGDLKDAYGNASTEDFTINFSVGSKLDNTIKETDFDYIVSNMAELKAALDQVNATNKNKEASRKYIYLKKGTYDANSVATGNSQAEITACQLYANYNVSLIGESRDEVVIIYTPYAEGMGERTITLGYGCYAQDITFKTGIEVGHGRGVALYTSGEHVIINNCRALGGQDTYLTGGTCYWKGGVVEGAVDFIFGGGDYLFDGTTLSVYNGCYITAGAHSANTEWGYVFKDCTIKPADASAVDGCYSLGRPWQGEPRAAYINTEMEILPPATGWGNMGKMPTHYYEYNSMHNGVAVDLSQRFCSDSQNQTTAGTDYTLTAEQAAEFTMINIFGEVDGWYPEEEIPTVIKPGTTGGINEVQVSSFKVQGDEAIYNLRGQRVDSSYRGLVIINGQKLFKK